VALCPSSPEAIHRYVNFLMKEKRNSDALLIAQTAAHLAPEEKQFKDLMGELSRHQESENTPAKNDFETLRALESRKTQAEANLDELKATLQTLKSQSRQELQKILPTLVPDAQFDTLMTRLNDARMEVNRVKMTYAVSTTKYQSAQADVDTLQKQVQDRIDGILISLQVRIDASAALLDSLKKGNPNPASPILNGGKLNCGVSRLPQQISENSEHPTWN
jgi:vacuolar-type H+-ATPase subunit I/STV1